MRIVVSPVERTAHSVKVGTHIPGDQQNVAGLDDREGPMKVHGRDDTHFTPHASPVGRSIQLVAKHFADRASCNCTLSNQHHSCATDIEDS